MNALRNRVQLIGNLGANPEIKKFENGKTLARISLATTEKYKNEEGKLVSETQWHHVTAWGNLANTAEKYLKKGSEVVIEGKLIYRNYENKEGKKQYITEIVAHELVLLGKKDS
ncbi:MAG: single-stranded DNA-binding protein [Bacteroidetes bacterium]|nr:single-stranded DNA-binding protein [Bacteroidota bacterium]